VTPIRAIAREFDETGGGTTATGEVIFGLHVVNALTTMALGGRIPAGPRRLRTTMRPGHWPRAASGRVVTGTFGAGW
jgi:hypothetical protein